MRRLPKILIGLASVLALAIGAGYGLLRWYGEAVKDPAFFEDDIQAFEAETGLPTDPIVFIGSSSIALWDTLAEDMAPLPVVNRGFGGSQMFHLVHNGARILRQARPSAVVVYAGDNDLDESTGRRAEDVLADYRTFVEIVKREAPRARVFYVSIKPSPLRWERWPEMSRANAMIAAWSETDAQLEFIDIGSAMLGENGEPRRELFRFDGLHLNEDGYALWTQIIKPRLSERA